LEQTRYLGFRTRSIRPLLATSLAAVLFGAAAASSAMAQNTFTGTGAGSSITSGAGDSGFGLNALQSVSTGNDDTAAGSNALQSNTTADNNTATGSGALSSNTTGSDNTASGARALLSNVTGNHNTAAGSNALLNNTTGNSNTASGFNALQNNSTGNSNTAAGSSALQSNTTGIENTATGLAALGVNTVGNDNVASGAEALANNTTGSENTACGKWALLNNDTGNTNTATGSSALLSNVAGSGDTANGFQALQSNTTGDENTALGQGALFHNTIENLNIGIGFNAGSNLINGSNNIDIGNVGVAADADTIRIGTNGTHSRTFVAGINHAAVYGSPVFVNASGRLGIMASSVRFKRDIHDMNEATGKLMKLRPVTFRYKDDPVGALQYGLVAEEVARVYPELVTYGTDGKAEAVAYHLLPAILLKQAQRQVRENEQEDARIAALQGQVTVQQRQISALRQTVAWIDTLGARLNALEERARIAKPERLADGTR
jgi:hypothetical protein